MANLISKSKRTAKDAKIAKENAKGNRDIKLASVLAILASLAVHFAFFFPELPGRGGRRAARPRRAIRREITASIAAGRDNRQRHFHDDLHSEVTLHAERPARLHTV